ncbi:hypothetical protein AB4F11_02065 [Francisella philomiragia]
MTPLTRFKIWATVWIVALLWWVLFSAQDVGVLAIIGFTAISSLSFLSKRKLKPVDNSISDMYRRQREEDFRLLQENFK